MNRLAQLKLLVWKNLKIQKKHKLATAFEIGLPICMVVILVIIRHYISKEEQCTTNKDMGGYCDYTLFTPALFPLIPPCTTLHCDLNVSFAPDNNMTRLYMAAIKNYYGLNTKGFATEDKMVAFLGLQNNTKSSPHSVSPWLGGIVFNTTNKNKIHYSIRLDAVPRLKNHSEPKVKNWRTRWVYPVFQVIGPREINNSFGGDPGYFREGFLALQHAIDRAIIMSETGKFPQPVVMKRMPYPKFELDGFIYVIENTLPFLLLIAFLAMNINVVRAVVTEKEKRIKEAMKIMGLSGWVHAVGWYIEIMMVMIIPVILIAICLRYGLYLYSDPSLLFVFLLAYTIASISFSFLICTLFSRANVAAGAAGVFWFLNYSPYFFLQQFYENMSVSQKLGVSLLSNTAMGVGSKVLAEHEAAEIGVQWADFLTDTNTGDLPFGSIVLVLVFDTFLYILLAWYIEAVFPGEFGVPKKWYFPFTPSYWGFCQSEQFADMIINETTPLVTNSSAIQRNAYYETVAPSMDPIVDIQNLTKQYPNSSVKAVDNLNLQLYKGQIFALLGHNGAGKTTTISMLTGLYPPSKGTAYIMGRDIRTSLAAVRRQIGYCPQYNVLFDELTVEDHLIFFCFLKGMDSAIRYEVEQMIQALGLEDKRHVVSKKLSGGMKRKLSCANALIGNSKIVFLDEPTAGMDPAARRSTWDLLLNYKKDKTIVLTTHHMDEADLLGDRIGIMGKGNLCCVGSSMFLKKQFGIGYHMTIVKNEEVFNTEAMNNFVTTYIPGSKIEGNVASEISFLLPEDQVCNFERFFTDLEREQHHLGVDTYGLSLTTLEEVFMRVEELGRDDTASPNKLANEIFTRARQNVSDLLRGETSHEGEVDRDRSGRSRAVQIRDHFNKGSKLTLQQMWAMVVKRYYYSFRNIKTLLMQLLMPVLFTMIPLIVIKNFPSMTAAPPRDLTVLMKDNMFDSSKIIYQPALSSPAYDKFIDSVGNMTKGYVKGIENISDFQHSDNMTQFILEKIEKTHGHFNKDYVMGFSVMESLRASPDLTVLWFNNRPYHTIPVLLNLYTNAYLNSVGSDVTVTVTDKPLPPSTYEKVNNVNDQIFAFMVAFNVMFGFAFLASSFVIFIVKERISGTRHLQMLSGLNPIVYWVSSFMWDMLNFLVPSLLMLILFQTFGVEAFCGSNLAIVLLVELLYGWAVIPLMYLMANIFKNEVVAYTRLIMLNVLTGTGASLVIFILSIPDLGLESVGKTLKWFFLFLPNFDLGQALGDMYLNFVIKTACEKSIFTKIMCKAENVVYQTNFLAWENPGIGRYVVWLAMLGFVFLGLVVLLEYISINKYKQKLSQPKPFVPDPYENEDVKRERQEVLNSTLTDYTVRIENLTKVYDSGKNTLTAVDHLCLGIPAKETFGLLGVNGAGKTSTFKMLTGDLPISSGSATICGYDVTTDINSARKFIGYCPQFDAFIECMTPREHLMMYARLRGVPEEAVVAIVERTLNELSLLTNGNADNHASKLSGGNKRKLATAIAVIGYPPVVFLDEPTAGLDVAARRALWEVLCKVRKLGTAIILTSHSMEECEALCTRLAIMVNGQLKCIGSLQELKSKYGAGYNVQVKVKSDSNGQPETTQVQGFMRLHFPEAKLEEEHHGLLQYIIPKAYNVTWAAIFSLLERHKDQIGIQDYSVSQTTLEQVFLSFAKSQRGEDDSIEAPELPVQDDLF
ncbi:phospholipid-transporting ATPase ABCA3-like isoform X2 [Bolinopsis microptera]|uniref:phospholipid-transporting ATPase ABCA3-like isoform X2 n=1 Tax=Bolinopsis microptera TaxID=2820187 RepID=UPI0030798F02